MFIVGRSGSSSTAAKNAVHHARSVKLTSDAKGDGGSDAIFENVPLILGTTVAESAWVTPHILDSDTIVGSGLYLPRMPLSIVPSPQPVVRAAITIPDTLETTALKTCEDIIDDPAPSIPTTSNHTPANTIPSQQSTPAKDIDGPSSMKALKHILSPAYLNSPANTATPNTIRSFYNSVKARSQLHHLTPSEYSSLIALFGGISTLNHPPSDSFYSDLEPYGLGSTRDLVFHIVKQERERAREPRAYWAFVNTLVNDKQKFARSRLDSDDEYWVMRVKLASLESTKAKGAT